MDNSQFQLLNWISQLKRNQAPHIYKQMVVLDYARTYRSLALIETGTYLGDMIEAMTNYFELIVSIELSPQLYSKAVKKFNNIKKINLFLGDSGSLLPNVLNHITFGCVFWLDGHFSEGITAKSDINTPIIKELNAILNHDIKDHVILIDDARLFNGTNDYPTIREIEDKLEGKDYVLEIRNDIIRITPKLASSENYLL